MYEAAGYWKVVIVRGELRGSFPLRGTWVMACCWTASNAVA